MLGSWHILQFLSVGLTREDFWSLSCPLASSCKPPFPFYPLPVSQPSSAVRLPVLPCRNPWFLTSLHSMCCNVCMSVAVRVIWDLYICRWHLETPLKICMLFMFSTVAQSVSFVNVKVHQPRFDITSIKLILGLTENVDMESFLHICLTLEMYEKDPWRGLVKSV